MIELRDYIEIQELYARYNHYIDDDRFDEWVHLFATDGVYVASETHRGYEALSLFVRDRAQRHAGLDMQGRQHWISNLVLDAAQDDLVRGTCYLACVAVSQTSGTKQVVTLGRYDDEIVRVDGTWRFARRTYRDGYPGE